MDVGLQAEINLARFSIDIQRRAVPLRQLSLLSHWADRAIFDDYFLSTKMFLAVVAAA